MKEYNDEELKQEFSKHLDDDKIPTLCEKCGYIIWTELRVNKMTCHRCGTVNLLGKEEVEELKNEIIANENSGIKKSAIRYFIIHTVIVWTLLFFNALMDGTLPASYMALIWIETYFYCMYLFIRKYRRSRHRINKLIKK